MGFKVLIRKIDYAHDAKGRFATTGGSKQSSLSYEEWKQKTGFQVANSTEKPVAAPKFFKPKPSFKGNQNTTEGNKHLAPDYHSIKDVNVGEPEFKDTVRSGSYVKTDKETGEKTTKYYTSTMAKSSGMVLVEPGTGRIYIVEPRNHFGGYVTTFPKGRLEDDNTLTPQQSAHRELFEETGLHAKIVGYLGDYKGDTTNSRMYIGVRTGGKAMPSKETWGTHLVTPQEAYSLLNRGRDKNILQDLVWDDTYHKIKNGILKFNENHDDRGRFSSGGSLADEGKLILQNRASSPIVDTFPEHEAHVAAHTSWGGVTIDTHTGEIVEPKTGYAVTAREPGQKAIEIPENSDEATLHDAIAQARDTYPQLAKEGMHLGVFHDDDKHTIDIDPTVIVPTTHHVDAIVAYNGASGGAYEFATGNGYWPPGTKPIVIDKSTMTTGDLPAVTIQHSGTFIQLGFNQGKKRKKKDES